MPDRPVAPPAPACSARASRSAWPHRATRSRAASTATASRTTTGRPGRAPAGPPAPVWPVTSGATPRRRSTVPPSIGCNAFRLSVEWARLEPRPGAYDARRPRALRRDPLPLRRAGPGADRHAAPFHPPLLARRGVLAAAGLTRRLRPPRGAGRPGAGAVLQAMGDHQRAQHRDADGLDRGCVPPGTSHGRLRCLLRPRQPPDRARAGGRRRDGRPARRRGHGEHELVVGLRARPHAARPAAAARGRRRSGRRRPLHRRASDGARRRLSAAPRRGGGDTPLLRRRVALRRGARAQPRSVLDPVARYDAPARAAPRRRGGVRVGAAARHRRRRLRLVRPGGQPRHARPGTAHAAGHP